MDQETEYSAQNERRSDVATANRVFPVKRISWSSVFAGVLVAIAIQLALSLLGIGIGLSTVDVMKEANPVKGLGTGTAIWYALSSLIALYAAGWVAGRLAQTPRVFDAVIHGLLAWSLITLLTFYLLTTTIGSIIGGIGSLVGNTLSTVGNVAGKAISAAAPAVGDEIQDKLQDQGIDLGDIKREAQQILRQTGKPALQPENLKQKAEQAGTNAKQAASQAAANPQNADNSIDEVIDQLFNKGENTASAIDKEAVVNVIVARSGKSREEANQIAENWMKTYQQSKEKLQQAKQEAVQTAKQAADAAADAVSTASIIAFFSLVIGAVVAGFGARQGTYSKENAAVVNAAN